MAVCLDFAAKSSFIYFTASLSQEYSYANILLK